MDDTLRIGLVVVGGLALAFLSFRLAGRMQQSVEKRARDALVGLTTNAASYRDAPNPLERAVVEGTRLRFMFRDQRALLSFALPAAPSVVLSPFGGFEDDGLGSTRLRFWFQPHRKVKTERDTTSFESPWHSDARPHLDALATLGHRQGVCIATTEEGLFVMKSGWIGTSKDRVALPAFVEHACALVSLHLEGRLFETK